MGGGVGGGGGREGVRVLFLAVVVFGCCCCCFWLLLFLAVVVVVFASACERICTKTQSIEIRFIIIGPKTIMFAGAYVHFSSPEILHAAAVKGLKPSRIIPARG